ncbi:MAG: DUF262 domain-containing protein [candidate division WOR-3 bacterium]
MGKFFSSKMYIINDFRQWRERKELELSPKFQRRNVWSDKAKSYLIDTILKGFPIPPIFIREKIELSTHKTTREVIDGQQRLSAILDYLEDGFKVLKTHNENYGGIYFSDLPEEVQSEFLRYEILTNVISAEEDKVVLEIFARLNTYTVPLNKTEILNAKYFGIFKQMVHSLAWEYNTFWTKSKILSENKIARMEDVALTSELVIASLDGIKDKKEVEKYYKQYDDKFELKEEIKEKFKKCMDIIGYIYGDQLPNSFFNRIPPFYSLYCVLYDFLFGLNGSNNQIRINDMHYVRIKNALENLESHLEETEGKTEEEFSKIKEFVNDCTRHTTTESVRKKRHNFLLNFIGRYLQ